MDSIEEVKQTIPREWWEGLIWLTILSFLYLMGYLASLPVPVPHCCLRWCQRHARLNGHDEFQGGEVGKGPIDRASNFFRTMIYGMALAYVNPLFSRFEWGWESLIYLIPATLTIFIFSYVGGFKGMDTSCSLDSCHNWPWDSVLAYMLAIIGISGYNHLFGVTLTKDYRICYQLGDNSSNLVPGGQSSPFVPVRRPIIIFGTGKGHIICLWCQDLRRNIKSVGARQTTSEQIVCQLGHQTWLQANDN